MNKQLKELCERAGMECSLGHWYIEDEHLERFADLVRQDEREAIVDIVVQNVSTAMARECEDAIRARGEK